MRSRLILFIIALSVPSAFGDDVEVGFYLPGSTSGWEEQSFVNNTRYRLVQSEQGQYLQADTAGSASGLFREIEVDLTETPYLHWSWRVDNVYTGNDERTREGDDYPARIFVVVSGGLLFWKTRAINYAWSSNQAVGTQWNSAVARNAMMFAVRSGDAETGQWLHERRNIREDFQALFGEDITRIDAIAIMSDSDNTGQSARAYYADIYFSDQ